MLLGRYARWSALALVVAGLAAPSAALAEKTCPWLKQVLADRENEFTAFKGAERKSSDNNSPPVAFKGTLELNVTGKAKEYGCELVVRRRLYDANGQELSPGYHCAIAWKATFEQGSADYELIAGKLRECMPGLAFSDSRTGDVAKQTETWSFKADADGATIALTLADVEALAEMLSGKKRTGKPGVLVEIAVYNHSPLRPGLEIEIPVMK